MKHLKNKLTLFFVFVVTLVYGSPKDSTLSVILLDGPGWKLVGLEPEKGEKIGINKISIQQMELIPVPPVSFKAKVEACGMIVQKL